MTTSDEDLRHDLTLALHTITETNQSVRFADTKAAALAGIQALMVTVLAARHESAQPVAVRVLQGVCLLGVLTSALLLAAGQVPRIFDHPSRVSFPSLVHMPADVVLTVPSLQQRHEDAWRQASSLARIAVTKYRWLIRAAASTALTLAGVLAWLACVTWS